MQKAIIRQEEEETDEEGQTEGRAQGTGGRWGRDTV